MSTKTTRRGNPGKPFNQRRKPVNVTLHPVIRKGLSKLAFKRGLSLSGLIESLARAELERCAPTPPATPASN